MTYRTEVGMPDFDPGAYRPGDRYEGAWQATAECGWAGTRTKDYKAAKRELEGHVTSSHPAERRAAERFYAYATDKYNDGGWDVVVEAMTIEEIAETFAAEGITSLSQALRKSALAACVDVWADREADARNSAF